MASLPRMRRTSYPGGGRRRDLDTEPSVQLLLQFLQYAGVSHPVVHPAAQGLIEVAYRLHPVRRTIQDRQSGDIVGEKATDALAPEERVRRIENGRLQRRKIGGKEVFVAVLRQLPLRGAERIAQERPGRLFMRRLLRYHQHRPAEIAGAQPSRNQRQQSEDTPAQALTPIVRRSVFDRSGKPG